MFRDIFYINLFLGLPEGPGKKKSPRFVLSPYTAGGAENNQGSLNGCSHKAAWENLSNQKT